MTMKHYCISARTGENKVPVKISFATHDDETITGIIVVEYQGVNIYPVINEEQRNQLLNACFDYIKSKG